MVFWVLIHTNGSYTDMTDTSYFNSEKEGMDEYDDLTSQDTIDYHNRQAYSYGVRLEKVTLVNGEFVTQILKEFTYDDSSESTWES